ncbi:LOW QUALITY PROTEIN: uncharacterized protein [Nicotiana tomentosiformis]|uniref:LOW QUALITY PROTEIN: uncharacterized protein n=1 Tax=Nicotiana tomentosiformis TaxID=4098 RepID=UPI00388C39E1
MVVGSGSISYSSDIGVLDIALWLALRLRIVGLYPKGSPFKNSQRPRQNPGRRGGLEIVFNQQ